MGTKTYTACFINILLQRVKSSVRSGTGDGEGGELDGPGCGY